MGGEPMRVRSVVTHVQVEPAAGGNGAAVGPKDRAHVARTPMYCFEDQVRGPWSACSCMALHPGVASLV